MKQWMKSMVMVLLVGCVVFGSSREVNAQKTLMPEWTEKGDWPFYDYGTSTEDGVIQISTDSHSLKAGDIVDVQMMMNYYDDERVVCSLNMQNLYNADELELIGMSIKDEYQEKYNFVPFVSDQESILGYDCAYVSISDGGRHKAHFLEGRMATVKYRIKKDLEYLDLYYTCIDYVTHGDNPVYVGYGYYDYEDSYVALEKDGIGVLTLHITDTPSSTLTLSTTPVQGSEEITVPINIKANDGFNLLGIDIDYDPLLFTCDNPEEALVIDGALQSKISLKSAYESPGSGKIKASFIALDDVTDTGDFLKLKLKVKDGVPAGTTSNVNVTVTQAGNRAETAMSGTGTSCAVTVAEKSSEGETPVLGDVNTDKKIDLIDAVYILQNYNQIREFTAAQQTAADVDKNGKVDLIDALFIMKYYNGEISGF